MKKAADLLFLMALGSDPCGFSAQVFSGMIMQRFSLTIQTWQPEFCWNFVLLCKVRKNITDYKQRCIFRAQPEFKISALFVFIPSIFPLCYI